MKAFWQENKNEWWMRLLLLLYLIASIFALAEWPLHHVSGYRLLAFAGLLAGTIPFLVATIKITGEVLFSNLGEGDVAGGLWSLLVLIVTSPILIWGLKILFGLTWGVAFAWVFVAGIIVAGLLFLAVLWGLINW